MIKSNCGLCERNDLLLGYEFTATQIQNAFFSLTKNLFHKEFVDKIQLCVICTHKIEISSEIVREYKETCNRNNTLNSKKCFFCEDKAAHLIDFNKNPIEAENKINVFLNSVNVKRNYKDFKSCIRCLYNLETWTEMRNKLFIRLNLFDVQSPTRNDKTRLNYSSFKISEPKTTSDDTPIKIVTTSILDKNGNATSDASINSEVIITPNNTTIRRHSKTTNSSDNQKLWWNKYLNEKFKGLQTVNKIVRDGSVVLNITNIEDKLLNALPFVEIPITSQISKDKILQNDITNVTVSDDSKGNKFPIRTPSRKLNLSLIKKDRPKSQQKPKKRGRFRFKMPTKKSSQSLIETPPTVQSEPERDDSDESSKSVQVISSESESEKHFTCEICDKNFIVKCDYLAHNLKHEKMEEVIINVLRHDLPIQLNVTELSPKRHLKEITSPANINRLLTKWIGEHAAKLYEAADECINEKTERMIEEETVNSKAKDSNENQTEESRDPDKSKTIEESRDFDNSEAIGESQDPDKSETVDESSEKENEELDVNTTENLKEVLEQNDDNDGKLEADNENRIINSSDKDNEENKIDNAGADNHHEEEKADSESEIKDQAADQNMKDIPISISDSEDDDKETEDNNKGELGTSVISLDEDSEEQRTDSSNMESNNENNTSVEVAEVIEDSSRNKDNNENESATTEIKEHSTSIFDEDNVESNENNEIIEKSHDNITNCKDTDIIYQEKEDKNDNVDEFGNSDVVSPPVMTCEDLLNILETNIDSEEIDENNDTTLTDSAKRKRETENEDDVTPKRKKVRFADEKEIYSPDQEGVVLEKVEETLTPVPDKEEDNET